MNKFYADTSDAVTELEKKNQATIRSLAGECFVLLENDGTLPFTQDTKKIALFGSGARHTIKGGTGSGDVNTREIVSIYQGLKAEGFQITTEELLDKYDEVLKQSEIDYQAFVKNECEKFGKNEVAVLFESPYKQPEWAKISAADIKNAGCDVAVYVISRNSGEGADRYNKKGDYYLSDTESENISFLRSSYKKLVILLNVGGIIDATQIKSMNANAVLLIGQSGNIGGYVVAEALTGKQIPSGRLTDTWAAKYEDYPSSATFSHNNGNIDDEFYSDGVFVGYRYFDTFGVQPVYPFGYGKNYTTFTQEVVKVSADARKVCLEVKVTNTGDTFAGKDVVQVYVSAPGENKPFQELKAFAKTGLLAPKQSETVSLSFDFASAASYCQKCASWVLSEGEYIVRAGQNSRCTKVAAVISLNGNAACLKLKNCFGTPVDLTEITAPADIPVPAGVCNDTSAAPRFEIDAAAVECKTVKYQGERPVLKDTNPGKTITLDDVIAKKATVEELVAQLTVEEMADFCCGTARNRTSKKSVIGSSWRHIPGVAAETSEILMESRNVPWTSLVDGPAGLRITPHFKVDRKTGEVLPGGEIFGTFYNPFPADTPEDAIDYYQYCSAIPIATTLANSWNMNLVEEMGKVVGAEMKKFKAHFWLAPGMNIHRNPLCGRNFEYYSEDPLLSGKCAAADTKGVQSFAGQGTTIKHFAANNQEDNRNYCNNHMSERALREIYLKGFEIAVKESQPYSIMTSYNLINGVHTANCYDLIQSAARDEWGFEGVIMTDWYSSQDTSFMNNYKPKYPWSSSVQCIKAGNDWQMPGCEDNIEDIIAGVAKGDEITLGDLQFCTCNILRVIAKIAANS